MKTFKICLFVVLHLCVLFSTKAEENFFQLKEFIYKDTKITFADNGNLFNRPLIFIHGSPGSWESWSYFFKNKFLSENYHLMAINRPGYKNSTFSLDLVNFDEQAKIIITLNQFNQSGKKAIIIGQSYGAPLAARTAMLYDQMISGVVVVAGPFDPDLSGSSWYNNFADKWGIRFLLPKFIKVCNTELLQLERELSRIQNDWDLIKKPVVSIHGLNDFLVSVKNQDFLEKKLTKNFFHSRIKVPNATHNVSKERPEIIINSLQLIEDYSY